MEDSVYNSLSKAGRENKREYLAHTHSLDIIKLILILY